MGYATRRDTEPPLLVPAHRHIRSATGTCVGRPDGQPCHLPPSNRHHNVPAAPAGPRELDWRELAAGESQPVAV